MNMKNNKKSLCAGIHQPNFMPWLGFFYKWSKCDTFVFLDNVQFTKGSIISRVKIKTIKNDQWLTIPVKQKGRYPQLISEVEIENNIKWGKKVLGTIKTNYAKTPYFKKYFYDFENIINKNCKFLVDLNIDLLKWLANELNIKTNTIKSSELKNIKGKSTEKLISICNSIGAKQYVSGFGGQKYQKKELFKKNDIELIMYDFKHPEYNQLWGQFIPGLSIIDLLFNLGYESGKILRNKGIIKSEL